ncbi:hypothetical protein SODALDRAFT_340862 [Sodiomyces alkalinus F11]|uniref:GPI anchored protein n=1 Tax=Sodiomyces alkalinus (strain CBS 110278 / VKM F-3762 / F11) TaxID=1314773 RepID=A0A3N2PT73_SODAK|nr:hypothetical protein SODALDRAFT_340862 [Sodiomyces alkalinus F11]ROT37688.1 hypothetical protein SODALDRAFT_340862 [Sodiomyces alkalinus F11]
MRPATILGLPSSLLLLVAAQVEAQEAQRNPTAIRKMPLDSSEKLFPEYLSFSNDQEDAYRASPFLSPREAVLAARLQLSVEEESSLAANVSTTWPGGRRYRPAFQLHQRGNSWNGVGDGAGWELLRRARESLNALEGRHTCPEGMKNCGDIGEPNKCCMSGENCVEVEDPSVGNVACCPQGAECGGPVGSCPDGSPSCSTELGGGCCIPGFVCRGVGCVPSPPAVPSSTSTSTSTTSQSVTTVTRTSTTTADGGGLSTVVVTVIVTESNEPSPVTSTRTSTVTPSTSNSAAIPPFRPTSTESETTETTTAGTPGDYCPTGFYACLARDGGGCCRTGRDCGTTDCPSTPLTTIVTDGATVVVPITDVPTGSEQTTESCASGWFLCGQDAGPVAGCCPSGYSCGTASCSTVIGSQTAEVQKQFPDSGAARWSFGGWAIGMTVMAGAIGGGFIVA